MFFVTSPWAWGTGPAPQCAEQAAAERSSSTVPPPWRYRSRWPQALFQFMTSSLGRHSSEGNTDQVQIKNMSTLKNTNKPFWQQRTGKWLLKNEKNIISSFSLIICTIPFGFHPKLSLQSRLSTHSTSILTQIIQIYVPCTYLINVSLSLLKASCYSAGFEFVFKIYYVGDPSAILWSAFPIKSEEGSRVLRREIMIAYG